VLFFLVWPDRYACAEFPNPTPMEVYTDRENPENSIKCYLMLSMFQGDLVQQGASAKVTGHQGENGCPRCFLLATKTLTNGTDLGTQRWLGYCHPATAQVIQMPEAGGQQAQIVVREDLQFVAEEGGTFNRELADSIEISHEQHKVRTSTAAAESEKVMQQHPGPGPLPEGATKQQRDAHRTGNVTTPDSSQVLTGRC
jgi:hypothetical protein